MQQERIALLLSFAILWLFTVAILLTNAAWAVVAITGPRGFRTPKAHEAQAIITGFAFTVLAMWMLGLSPGGPRSPVRARWAGPLALVCPLPFVYGLTTVAAPQPYIALALSAVAACAVSCIFRLFQHLTHISPRWLCSNCGYDCSLSSTDRCPECGRPL